MTKMESDGKKVQKERKNTSKVFSTLTIASEPFRLAAFEIFSRVANKRAVNGETVIIIAQKRCTNDG